MKPSIRIPSEDELKELASYAPDTEHAVDVTRPDNHRGVYLAAWDDGVPTGHLFLRWQNAEVPRIVEQHPIAEGLAQARRSATYSSCLSADHRASGRS